MMDKIETCPKCKEENGPLIELNGETVCIKCFEKSMQKIGDTFNRLTGKTP